MAILGFICNIIFNKIKLIAANTAKTIADDITTFLNIL